MAPWLIPAIKAVLPHLGSIVSAAVQNRDGGPVVVLPADIATEKPVFPMPGWKQRG